MLSRPVVLLLSSDPAETLLLGLILSEHIDLTLVQNPSELQEVLAESRYDAAFCGQTFQSGTWEEALKQIQQYNPDLPVIICRRTGNERNWLTVLEAGGFDLLVAPYEQRALLATLEHAVASTDGGRLRPQTASNERILSVSQS